MEFKFKSNSPHSYMRYSGYQGEYIDDEYVITNPISDANLQGMRENMDESDLEQFDRFVEKHWKKSVPRETVPVSANVEENVPKRRGRKPKIEI